MSIISKPNLKKESEQYLKMKGKLSVNQYVSNLEDMLKKYQNTYCSVNKSFELVVEEIIHYDKNLHKLITETCPCGIVWVDKKGEIVYFNKEFKSIFNLKSNDNTRFKLNKLISSISDLEGNPIKNKNNPFIINKQDFDPVKDFICTIHKLDGKKLILSINKSAIVNQKGLFNGEVLSVENITKQQLESSILQESERKYKMLFERAPLAYQSLDENAKIIDVNPKWLSSLGYEREKVIGMFFKDILHDDSKLLFEERFPEFIKKGYTENSHFILKKKDGSFINALFEGCTGNSPEDGSFRTYCVFKDITKQKEYELALMESERRFRELHEKINLISVMLNKEGKITFLNEYLANLVGEMREDMIGKCWFSKYIPNGHKVKKVFFENIESGNIPAYYENPIVNKYGQHRIISWNNTILKDNEGRVLGTASIGEDITDKLEMDRQIMNAQVGAEERERKRFSEDLHDELGPFLAGIKLYINELGRESLSIEEREALADHLKKMVDEAIDKTCTISNGLMPNVLIDYGMINAVKSFASRITDTKYLNIKIKATDKDKRYDKNIEIILYRIIIELINNTIKHARATNIKIEFKQDEDSIHVNYQDDGKGFALDKVLEKSSGLGIRNMISRINSLGGIYSFQDTSIKGFGLNISIKFNN